MSWRLNKAQIYILVGICAAILLVFAALYYLQINPLKSTIESKKAEVETQQTVLDSISAKLNHTAGTTYQSTLELQKKLPVKPLGDQLILDFKKAEVISGSLILKMEVRDEELAEEAEAVSAQTTDATGGTDAVDSTETVTTAGEGSESNTQDAQTDPPLPLPQGVKKLSVKVTVEADDYDEIETFIETMESSRRIMKVDSIEFVGSEEVTSIEQSAEPLVYTLGISAFYSPDLIDLQKQLPDMETPPPANKDNPLSIAPDVNEATKKDNE